MNKRGFSLLEVILAIVIFSSFLAAVFYFLSGAINSNTAFKRRYTQLRILREFVDNFSSHEEKGAEEKEEYILEWQAYNMETKRRIVSRTPVNNYLQLKMIHLEMKEKENKNRVFSLNFIYNEFIPKKPDKKNEEK